MSVAVESEILAEFEKRNVVFLGAASILRMREMALNVDLLLASFSVTKIVFASDNFHSAASSPRKKESVNLVYPRCQISITDYYAKYATHVSGLVTKIAKSMGLGDA